MITQKICLPYVLMIKDYNDPWITMTNDKLFRLIFNGEFRDVRRKSQYLMTKARLYYIISVACMLCRV